MYAKRHTEKRKAAHASDRGNRDSALDAPDSLYGQESDGSSDVAWPNG
jgi:hypothetical protein